MRKMLPGIRIKPVAEGLDVTSRGGIALPTYTLSYERYDETIIKGLRALDIDSAHPN